jgi:hypothetical protein
MISYLVSEWYSADQDPYSVESAFGIRIRVHKGPFKSPKTSLLETTPLNISWRKFQDTIRIALHLPSQIHSRHERWNLLILTFVY